MEQDKLIDIHRRAHLVHEQILSAKNILLSAKKDPSLVLAENSPYFDLLNKLYEEEYPLAKLMMSSDIILHAEGPATIESSQKLDLITSFFSGINSQLRKLARSIFHLSTEDSKTLMKNLDIRLNGIAPGSIYAGFSVNPPKPTPLFGTTEENSMIDSIKETVTSLSIIPNFVLDNKISDELADFIPDPAIRDSALLTIYNLSPTGKKGIHTIDILSPSRKTKPSSLDIKKRVVLKETVYTNPYLGKNTKQGVFIGDIRALDLDKTRLDLRNIPDIGTLRCIANFTEAKAKSLLGKTVKISGEYEVDKNGKPRLMRAEKIEPIENKELPFHN